ncbi:MAG: hypothetical protein GY744_12880 [Gammaproteobacteria bacterium]|nr:hypothetical protein [Gammaproteobacteria bacterium]
MDNQPDKAESTSLQVYSIRRLNPFLGVLQVISGTHGRAVSANGVTWSIEMLGEKEKSWGSLNSGKQQKTFFRYGLWSAGDGLVRGMLVPRLNTQDIKNRVEDLLQLIQSKVDQLPFPLMDNRELWLFDQQDNLPLALLGSALQQDKPPVVEPKSWLCCMGGDGLASQQRFPQSSELEAQVKQRAGYNIHTHWVNRLPGGDGLIEDKSITLDNQQFPVFLIEQSWADAQQAERVNEYIRWISPSLLTLQHFTEAERELLEKNLNCQAISIEHHWRLYPQIINSQSLSSARVQCRLQQAQKHS